MDKQQRISALINSYRHALQQREMATRSDEHANEFSYWHGVVIGIEDACYWLNVDLAFEIKKEVESGVV